MIGAMSVRRLSPLVFIFILSVPAVALALTVATMGGASYNISDRGGYAIECTLRDSGSSFGDAYDSMYRLQVNGTEYSGTVSTMPGLMMGHNVFSTQMVGSLSVQRRTYVPVAAMGNYVRFLDVITNTGAAAATATVRIYGNLGSDSSTVTWSTGSGDTSFTTADSWLGTDDRDASGDPSLVHLLQGTDPASRATAAMISRDNPEWTFSLSVPAGETVAILTFGIVARTQAIARTEVDRILMLPEDALVGLDDFTSDIVNFATVPEGAPVIRFDAPFSVNEGEAFDISAMITDPEMDAVTFSWDLDDDGMFDEMPGVDTYSVMAGTTDGPATLRVGIRATDGMNMDERYRSVTIENVAPMITSTAPRTTSVGASYTYQIEAADPGGMLDPLVYEIVSGPETLTVDEMGLVSWTPSELDVTIAGEAHPVVARVSDGDEGVAEEMWEISVSPNRPPSAPRALFPLDSLRVDSPPNISVENATDPDLDTLVYFFEVDRSPMFDSAELQSSGEVTAGIGFTSWVPSGLEVGNEYYWRAWASDGTAESPRVGSSFLFVETPVTPPDASIPDGSLPEAGPFPEAGPITPPPSDDGCSCVAAGSDRRTPMPILGIGLLLGLAILRRRR